MTPYHLLFTLLTLALGLSLSLGCFLFNIEGHQFSWVMSLVFSAMLVAFKGLNDERK